MSNKSKIINGELEIKISEVQEQFFPNSRLSHYIDKLAEETMELKEVTETDIDGCNAQRIKEEEIDIFIVLSGVLREVLYIKRQISEGYPDYEECVLKKLEIIRNRKWKEIIPGYYHHVKD